MKSMMKNNRNGFVLVLSLLVISVLLVLTIPYVSRVVSDYRLTAKVYNSAAALDLAEAGAERALADNSFSGLGTLVNIGDYYVERSVSDEGLTTIKSTGYVPDKLSYKTKGTMRTVKVTYVNRSARKTVRAAGGGAGAITLGTQVKVDSYNSNNGTYAQTHTNSHGDIATNGSIVFGTQSKVYGDANPGADYPFASKPSNVYGAWGTGPFLTLDPIPQATLDGGIGTARNILPAENLAGIIKGNPTDPSPLDGNNNLSVGTQKTITLSGGTEENPAVYYFKSITLSTQAKINVSGSGQYTAIYVDGGNINVGTQGIINLSGTTSIYLNRGDSQKSGNINVGTQGKVNINGESIFYVDGGDINISTQADINTATHIPKDLKIYSSGDSISLGTQVDFYGAIYAPNAAVLLTTQSAQGEIFGSVACNTLSAGTQAALHFDLALLNEQEVFTQSNGVTSWQETQQ